jgi:soluble lytic murein transglycosylase-like protein
MRILNLIVFVLTFGYVTIYLIQHTPELTYRVSTQELSAAEVVPLPIPKPKPKTTMAGNSQDYSQTSLAIAISSLYTHVSFEKALRIVEVTHQYAEKYEFKPTLLLGIIAAESSFKQHVTSSHGAVGYTQVLPKYHQDKIKNRDLFNIHVNLEVGSRILGDCFKRRGNQTSALACYNGATKPDQINRYVTKVNKRKQQILKLASI